MPRIRWIFGWLWFLSVTFGLGSPLTHSLISTLTSSSPSASPPSGVQGTGSSSHTSNPPPRSPTHNTSNVDQCELQVFVRPDPHPVIIDYELVRKHPQPSCNTAQPIFIPWYYCNGTYTGDQVIYLNDGSSYCMHKKGSFKLKYKDVETRCFHLSGLELKHDDLIIMNDFKAKVKFHGLPRWAKALHVWVVDVQGKACGEVKHVKETPIIVPGNYTVNQEYYLKYQPEMHEEMKGECSTMNGRQSAGPYKYFNRKEEKGSDAVHANYHLIANICFGVSCLLLGAVAINYLVNNTKGRVRRSFTCPALPLLPSPVDVDKDAGDMLLVHAEDTTHMARLCQGLKAVVTKCCGRKVLDISHLDSQRLESPQTWLLKVLSHPQNKVLLVVSPALTALHRAIQQDNDAAGCIAVAAVRGKMYPWDGLLPICLKYLQQHLCQDYSRLFVIKFEQVTTGEDEDISELVPAKRFLLPQHYQELHRELGGYQV